MQPDSGNPATPDSSPAAPAPATATADPGLPPVKPPSARFILQLFLVPGFIIAVAVGLFLFVKWMTGGARSPEQFLKDLDNPNAEVRWRAAADLGQVLPRDGQLATNPVFGLELADRVRRLLKANADAERARREGEQKGQPLAGDAMKALKDEREYLLYLAACLGNFQVPVGAPLLAEMAEKDAGIDAENDFRRKSQAILSLTVMGKNLRQFDQLPPERKTEIMLALKEEAGKPGERAEWAKAAFDFLDARIQKKPTTALPIADLLVRLAKADAPFLRKLVTPAFAFWDNEKAEETLLALTQDDGRGEDPIQRDKEQEDYRKAHPEEIRKLNQRQIAYNAVLCLAHRGSAKLGDAQYDLLREMLDEEAQKKIWYTEDPLRKGSWEADAVQMVDYTLKAVDQLRRQDPKLAQPLRDSVVKLVGSSNPALSAAAKELREKWKVTE